jgi:hypothetical protein
MIPIGIDLSAMDYAMLAKSGISQQLAADAGIRRVSNAEGMVMMGRSGRGDYAGIVFPYRWPGDVAIREYRLRRDHPEVELNDDGKEKERAKYISPPGRSNMLYFPPGVQVEQLSDSKLPILITEGEKKTLALSVLAWRNLGEAAEKPRWLSVGLSGVWNWRGTVGKTSGPDGERRDIKGVIPDVDKISWRGRDVTIVFDRNAVTNQSVMAALVGLSHELRRRGSIVRRFVWPKHETVNGIDDVVGKHGADFTLALIQTNSHPITPTERDQQNSPRKYDKEESGHRLEFKDVGVTFQVDRMRRDRHELIGELTVRCSLAGAKTVDGCLSVADFNFSSLRARLDRAKHLSERANATQLDWVSMIEEFCQKVFAIERQGAPAVDLRTVEMPPEDDDYYINGLVFPRRHPTILFGDGSAGKSYIALWVAGQLEAQGFNVALFDWELAASDHRVRLQRLFPDMPRITYCRCEFPITHEIDRLRRVVTENQIDFAIFDSIAFACNGRPEDAEIASQYYRAVRSVGVGSLHIAHINKSEDGDKKPFGSVFWHNGARMTWYAHAAERADDNEPLTVGLFNRKANLNGARQPVSLRLTFGRQRTDISRVDMADTPDLASKLTIRQRMTVLLKRGSMTEQEIADELEASLDSVRKAAKRNHRDFILLSGGRIGLVEKGA